MKVFVRRVKEGSRYFERAKEGGYFQAVAEEDGYVVSIGGNSAFIFESDLKEAKEKVEVEIERYGE